MKEFRFDSACWVIGHIDPVKVISNAMDYFQNNQPYKAYECLSNFYNIDLIMKERTEIIVKTANKFFNEENLK